MHLFGTGYPQLCALHCTVAPHYLVFPSSSNPTCWGKPGSSAPASSCVRADRMAREYRLNEAAWRAEAGKTAGTRCCGRRDGKKPRNGPISNSTPGSYATNANGHATAHQRHSGFSGTYLAAFRIDRGHRTGSIAGDQAQRHRRDLRRQQDRRGDDQSVPRRRRRYRGRVVAHPGTGSLASGPDERHVRTALSIRRHAAHRRHPGPGRTRADALGRAQGGPRLRALPRQPRPCPR